MDNPIRLDFPMYIGCSSFLTNDKEESSALCWVVSIKYLYDSIKDHLPASECGFFPANNRLDDTVCHAKRRYIVFPPFLVTRCTKHRS